jgi:hypothetical protein
MIVTGDAMLPSLPNRNMKRRIRRNWSLGLLLTVLPLAVGSAQESSSQSTNTLPAAQTNTAPPDVPTPAATVTASAPAEAATGTDVVDAPAKPMSSMKPLPPAVRPSAPVAEVLKLADSGVEENVMLSFVNNSTSTFNLGAEEIIYLNDLGVPSGVVTAMIQRDQALKASFANSAPAPATPPPAPAEPAPAAPEALPAPADMAPQPDMTAGNYPPVVDNTYATYYDSLAPYGTWLDVAGYGPCWQPGVVIICPGWQPYCNNGRWVYTDCGWYWLSAYSWGWAPFHYGRWFRHSHYGWCWMPGNVWGPSWVCWRYNGSYCGWAPLPPAAVYRPAVGLTYHGQSVSGNFSFGLGVNSYTFVAVNQFPNRNLNRYALPRQQAVQVYSQTVTSTTIAGSGTRIVNQGIPVAHVAAASRTQIHTVGIREMNAASARHTRGEQFEATSRSLSVFRPQFSPSASPRPASAGYPPSDVRPTGGNPVATPVPAASHVMPVQSPRAVGNSPVATPAGGGGSGRRPDRSPNQANVAPETPDAFKPTAVRGPDNAAPRFAPPLILHGPDRLRESADTRGGFSLDQAAPPNSLILRGTRRGGYDATQSQSPAPMIQIASSQPTYLGWAAFQ